MSVLSSLKSKLSTATLDFSQRYQKYWSDIHRASEANASKAQEVDALVAGISAKLSQQVTNINQFLTEMKKFDEIQSQIDTAREKITALDTSCVELEDKLVLLEDLYGETQQCNNKFEHEYQLRKYQERKHLELEQVKAKLARQHASRVQQFEKRMCTRLRERQQVFEAAFVEQMKNYRELGQLSDVSVVTAPLAAAKDLSDVAIDDDYSLLDEFLDSKPQTLEEISGEESLATGKTSAIEAEVTLDTIDMPESIPTDTEHEET